MVIVEWFAACKHAIQLASQIDVNKKSLSSFQLMMVVQCIRTNVKSERKSIRQHSLGLESDSGHSALCVYVTDRAHFYTRRFSGCFKFS